MKQLSFIIIISLVALLLFNCSESEKERSKKAESEKIHDKKSKNNVQDEKIAQPQGTFLEQAPEAVEPEIKDYNKIALRCQIVLLDDAVTGQFRKLTKSMALDFVEKGHTLVVRAENGAIFFVFDEDKTIANAKLARFAANDFIGILGKTKYEYGLNFIFARYIESSD